MNSDHFHISFTATGDIASTLFNDAEELFTLLNRLRASNDRLYASGLQGSFVDEMQTRSGQIENQLRLLAEEIDEAGRDLLTVVEWARQLDTDAALLLGSYSSRMIAAIGVAAGGSMPRAEQIADSITRLQSVRGSLLAQLQQVEQQMNAPLPGLLNRVFGVHDDYQQMHTNLSASLAQVDQRIVELQTELATPPSSQPVVSPISEAGLLQPLAVDQPAETAVTPQDSPAQAVSTTTVRNQFIYQYDGRGNDTYACSLYSQAAVLEAMGFSFDEELIEARDLGLREGWYKEGGGSTGLGQPFAANNIPYEEYGFHDRTITPEAALDRLESELTAGNYAVLNIDAPKLSAYRGEVVGGHSIWVTGIRTDADGFTTHIIANDSYWGETREYPVDEFLTAWGSQFNYYGVFARNPE
jgi:hypothetical protein